MGKKFDKVSKIMEDMGFTEYLNDLMTMQILKESIEDLANEDVKDILFKAVDEALEIMRKD